MHALSVKIENVVYAKGRPITKMLENLTENVLYAELCAITRMLED
jgi:hypothetical protein